MEMKKSYFIFKIQNSSGFLCILIAFSPYIFSDTVTFSVIIVQTSALEINCRADF